MVAIYIILVIGTLAAAAWLFLQENKSQNDSGGEASILNRLGLGENPASSATPAPGSSFTSHLSFFKKHGAAPEIEPHVEESRVEIPLKEIPTQKPADSGLEERYKRLDGLFQEKSEQLEKTEKTLLHEQKAKSEFNKVKDILEKEIRDLKDSGHKLDLQISAHKAEAENQKKRMEQLEEKLKARDQDILIKEKKLEDLTKAKAEEILTKDRKIEELAKKLEVAVAAVATASKSARAPEPQAAPIPQEAAPAPQPAVEILLQSAAETQTKANPATAPQAEPKTEIPQDPPLSRSPENPPAAPTQPA